MLKVLFLIHRWLGILLGLVMLLWCLSGFVMMYKPYPELTEVQKLATSRPLDLQDCCNLQQWQPDSTAAYQGFALYMSSGRLLLELAGNSGTQLLDATSGRPFPRLNSQQALQLARDFSTAENLGDPITLGSIHNDQWTVYGAYNPERPLYKYAAGDDAGTQWYVSSRNGSIVQITTADQRLWGWLGAVVHWLYPTLLRERVQLWSQTVIWLTIFGFFLTVTGLYFGLRQYRSGKGGITPYRGLSAWHHYTGLLFGILTLVWVVSGFFSMNPWGLLEGEGAQKETAMLAGGDLSPADIRNFTARFDDLSLPAGTVRLEGTRLLGETRLFAVDKSGRHSTLDTASLQPVSLPADTFTRISNLLGGTTPELLLTEDAYYYHHHEKVQLPVWRIIATDASHTRYYLSPETGRILSKVDTEKRWYRWLHYGLHRGDFTVFLRSRPVWDLLMWTLLLGVTATCLTGFCMGIRRLQRNAVKSRKRKAGELKGTLLRS
jgi:hypothetical protein